MKTQTLGQVCAGQWREGPSTPKGPGPCSQPASGPSGLGQGLGGSAAHLPCPGWTLPLPLALLWLSCAPAPSRDLAMGKPERPVGMVEMARPAGQKRPGFLEGGLLFLLLLVTGALVALGFLYADSRGE